MDKINTKPHQFFWMIASITFLLEGVAFYIVAYGNLPIKILCYPASLFLFYLSGKILYYLTIDMYSQKQTFTTTTFTKNTLTSK